MLAPIVSASLIVLAVTAGAADKPSASGTFTYNDKTYTPAHAVAFHEGPFVKVRFRDERGSGADFRCEGPGLLKLEKMDASVVKGSFKCQEHDVAFDAKLIGASR